MIQPPVDIAAGAKMALQLLDAKIAELVAGRDDVVRQLESRAQEVRQLQEQKDALEKRVAELQRLRERMARAIREEFGIAAP